MRRSTALSPAQVYRCTELITAIRIYTTQTLMGHYAVLSWTFSRTERQSSIALPLSQFINYCPIFRSLLNAVAPFLIPAKFIFVCNRHNFGGGKRQNFCYDVITPLSHFYSENLNRLPELKFFFTRSVVFN